MNRKSYIVAILTTIQLIFPLNMAHNRVILKNETLNKDKEIVKKLTYDKAMFYKQAKNIMNLYKVKVNFDINPFEKYNIAVPAAYRLYFGIDDSTTNEWLKNLDWVLNRLNPDVIQQIPEIYFVKSLDDSDTTNGLYVSQGDDNFILIATKPSSVHQMRYVLLHEIFHSLTVVYTDGEKYTIKNLPPGWETVWEKITDDCSVIADYSCKNLKETMADAFAYAVMYDSNKIKKNNQYFAFIRDYAYPALIKRGDEILNLQQNEA